MDQTLCRGKLPDDHTNNHPQSKPQHTAHAQRKKAMPHINQYATRARAVNSSRSAQYRIFGHISGQGGY